MDTAPNAGPDRGGRAPTTVQRIQLGNTVFEGANDVYVLDAPDEGLGLVDTGIATPETRDELTAGLAELGHTLGDVEDVLLTHWHPDHAGLAGAIQAASGATVRVHAADADLVAGETAAWDRYHDIEERRFEEWRLPGASRTELRSYLDASTRYRGETVDVTPFEDGDRVRVGGVDLDVVHLPGHAAGLCGFAFDAADVDAGTGTHVGGEVDASTGTDGDTEASRREHEGTADTGREAFVGDAILPKYTPNVGGADLRVESPLRRYVGSLGRVADAGWRRAWPGHRDPIDDPAGRARTILTHHRDRTRRVVDVLATHGPCDVWTVSAHLFGDLEEIHILHGPGEAWAHLDHLRAAGAVERDGHDYALVDPSVDVDLLLPDL